MSNKEKFPRIIFPGTFDPFTFAHLEAFNLAKKEFNEKIAIVIIENQAKKNKFFSVEERKAIINSYLPNVDILFAKDNAEWQKLWEKSEIAIRKFRGISDKEEDLLTCQKHGISFDKIKYFKLEKHPEISSLKIKTMSIIGQKPDGINDFTFQKLREKIPRNFSK